MSHPAFDEREFISRLPSPALAAAKALLAALDEKGPVLHSVDLYGHTLYFQWVRSHVIISMDVLTLRMEVYFYTSEDANGKWTFEANELSAAVDQAAALFERPETHMVVWC